ncbi:tRNA (adenine(22)-N(1))-methyltransferase [Lapidilactobacillus bayanensis]|uniref:tRNA (adenine(22)-N(1))-methyltransferase n=1 Tax=Lapidilactobacillus bayanensis TaxID=2485998 RepID=UPI000F76E5EF|nr:class I SAM-dependent methyltransferase [Lapidilactobacillus bayanensis]
MVKLSKRLQAVADLTAPWRRIADIGSDHAHLPLYLREQNKIEFAVCGEVIPGPYEIAAEHVKNSAYANNLIVRLADGLQAIQQADQVDCAVIAGMGGMLITQILDSGLKELTWLKGLVLQPNQNADAVRQWLAEHSWQITAENLVFDEGHYYQMMAAVPAPVKQIYSPLQLLMGPTMLTAQNVPVAFTSYWQFKLTQKQGILAQLKTAAEPPVAKISKMTAEIALIEEGLNATNRSTNY